MRNTKIAPILTAVALALLAFALGSYIQLGSISPQTATGTANRAVAVGQTAATTQTTVADPLPAVPPATHDPAPAVTALTTEPAPQEPPAPAPAAAPAIPTNAPASVSGLTYVVHQHDTLWALAAAHLGDPYRWVEIYELNRGRVEPGGRTFVNPDLIYAGWTLTLPAGATGLTPDSAAAPVAIHTPALSVTSAPAVATTSNGPGASSAQHAASVGWSK
jgi:nucleoid-associated protein YgaU